MKTKLDLTGMTSQEVEDLRVYEGYKISAKALMRRGWLFVTIDANNFNYYRNGQTISKSQFISVVPENWLSEVKDGEYSWGCYRAISII